MTALPVTSSLWLGDDTIQRVREVRQYAEMPEHWFDPETTAVPPGKNQSHIVIAGTVRAVFSWSMFPDGTVARHLSVSTLAWHEGNKTVSPLPIAVYTLAHLFGFTGARLQKVGEGTLELVHERGANWGIGVKPSEGAIIVIEAMPHVVRIRDQRTIPVEEFN